MRGCRRLWAWSFSQRCAAPRNCLLNKGLPIIRFRRVHVREIVVILCLGIARKIRGISPDRLPFTQGADISPATSISVFKDETMAIERTFSIIKPDATARNLTGAVNALIEKAGLRIGAQNCISITRVKAGTV